MHTNNDKGRNIAIAIGAVFLLKSILNVILGGAIGDIFLAAIEAVLLYTGLKYINYAIAVYTGIVIVNHFGANISNFSENWIYLAEAVVDFLCILLLVVSSDVKEHFSNKWSEISENFKK